jgi:hypothetical protein
VREIEYRGVQYKCGVVGEGLEGRVQIFPALGKLELHLALVFVGLCVVVVVGRGGGCFKQ